MAIIPFTIANGATVSNAQYITDYKVFALQFGTMTGATVSFQGSYTQDGPYVTIVDQDGTTISITATDNSIVGLDAAALEIAAVEWLKIVSVSAEGADRTIYMHAKK